jgi:Calcineurin-like phosphoesterase/Secretion system C-terminal sorting domain
MKKIIYFSVLFFSFQSQDIVAQINHIRWGTNKNPLEGLTITWQSTGIADKIKWGYTASFEQGIFLGIARQGYSNTFFDYKFPNLIADTTLYYQLLNSQNNTWTATKTFNTAPQLNTPNFSFIATGDSRGGADVWQAISDLANMQQTDLTIFNGDIVSDAGVSSQWDDWFDAGASFLEKNLVLHALGNHDALSIPTYLNNFELPKSTSGVNGTELYYAVNYGEAVIISLDSEIPEDTDQYNWLIATLQANQNKRWKIISFHKPFYTIGPHIGEMNDYFTTWWKAFDDYGVDLILNGHDHMYERAKPINRNISTTSPVQVYGSGPDEGRCQIVCGGAGAGLTNLSSGWYIESFLRSHNFCKFEVTHNTLCGRVYDETSIQIDSFCIDKTPLSTVTQKTNFYPITLVPNPTNDNFIIEYNSPNLGELIITLFDLNGKLINTKKSHKIGLEFSYKYDSSLLQSGVYSIELQMGNQKDHAILIKK